MRAGTSIAHRLRIITYVVSLALVALFDDGYQCHLVGGAATLAALILYFAESPRFFRLTMMWCAGYLLIIMPEGLSDSELISGVFGSQAYSIASRCLVGSQLAVFH